MSGRFAGLEVLVTGASSGIGRATVTAFSAQGARVHALARRAERLETLAAVTGAVPHAVDMTDTAALEALAGRIAPDVLVNNAGLGAGIAGLEGAAEDEVARTIGVNVTALLQALRLFLPGMRARGRGHVVNIGSVAGLYPIMSTVYGASKGAVRQISRNLRIELRGTGIRVTEIQPGRVSTEFYDAAIPDDAQTRDRLKTTGVRELSPEDIAGAVLYAVGAPAHVNISAIEIQPVEQSYGGVSFDPVDWAD
ncbi:MAG: SDR family oxidoreductase [Pseudomonadota bacterium]